MGNATWHRRSFLKTLGASGLATLVLAEVPFAGAGGQPCTYGVGLYGSGIYSGALSASLPAILADRSSNDLVLTWAGAPGGTTYEVWRSTQPFAPGDPGSSMIATVSGTSFVDTGALGNGSDFYYVVRGILSCE